MCNKGCCETDKCCNEKRISVAGKKGDTGPRGPAGPAGIAASSVYAAIITGLSPIPNETPTILPGSAITVPAGTYVADFDGIIIASTTGHGLRCSVGYGVYLNGVLVNSTLRFADAFYQLDSAQNNYCYSNISTRSIKFTIGSGGGVIDVRANMFYSGADTRPANCLGGTVRVFKL